MIRLNYRILFSIAMRHRYFADERCRGFEFFPSQEAKAWAESYRLLFRTRDSVFTVLCDDAMQNELLAELNQNVQLTFFVRFSDPLFSSYTEVRAEQLAYNWYFSNTHGLLLHAGETAGEEDMRTDTHPFGCQLRVDIATAALITDAGMFANPEYTIRFACRSTTWNYFVTCPPRVTIPQPAITGRRGSELVFTGPLQTLLPNGQQAMQFVSPRPLELKAIPVEIFQLKKNYETSFPGSGELVLDNLPNPPPESIRFDAESGAFLSDIYIHL